MNRTSLLFILVIAVAIDALQSSLTAAQPPAEGLVAAEVDITRGLVGHWKMDEGSGSILADKTANKLDAQLGTGRAPGYSWVDGKYGKGVNFGGTGYALVQNTPVLNQFSNGITVAAWLYRNAAGGYYELAVSREVGSSIYEHFGLGSHNSMHCLLICVGTDFISVHGGTVPIGQWYHLVGTWDGTVVKVYANGTMVAKGNKSGTFNFNDQNPLIIGGNSNNQGGDKYLNDAFNGRMDEVRLYNRALTPSEVAVLASAKPNPASPFIRPEAQEVCDSLQNLAAVSKEELARDIAVLAPGRLLQADDQDLTTFVGDLVQSLSGRKVAADHAAVLAGDLEQALNPGQGSVRQSQGAVRNFAHTLKLAGVDHAQADKVGANLTVLAKVPADPGPFDGPRNRFRYAPSEAPKYDKAVLVEDFESGTDIFKTWYQPYWSTGVVATFDSQHKSGGNRGLTISNTGPTTKRSSMAKFARPHQDLAGCNALRLWFKPYGLKASEGTVSMGFIDGSSEIWQVDLPEVLSATEPFVLQVRLADFRRVLRRNNGRIDLENRDFCFWMTGTYKFTVDDILFVHDPAVPEFSNTPTQNKLTK